MFLKRNVHYIVGIVIGCLYNDLRLDGIPRVSISSALRVS